MASQAINGYIFLFFFSLSATSLCLLGLDAALVLACHVARSSYVCNRWSSLCLGVTFSCGEPTSTTSEVGAVAGARLFACVGSDRKLFFLFVLPLSSRSLLCPSSSNAASAVSADWQPETVGSLLRFLTTVLGVSKPVLAVSFVSAKSCVHHRVFIPMVHAFHCEVAQRA